LGKINGGVKRTVSIVDMPSFQFLKPKKMTRLIFTLLISVSISVLSLAQPGPIKNLRYEDDFSYLKNDTIEKKWFEKLKFIPLTKSKKSHISFGGEIREWYEYRGNINFGDVPPDFKENKYGVLLHRFMFHTDLWIKNRFRFFGQINNTLEIGSNNEPIPEISQDGLGIHQAFVEFHLSKVENPTKYFFRIGRQEYNFGNELIISSREGPNNRQSFDAASFIINTSKTSIYTFVATPIIIYPHVFDNEHINEYMWGVYTYLRKDKKNKFDVYYLGFDTDRRSFNFVPGRQKRQTLGVRYYNHTEPWHLDLESIYQFGKFNELNISALHLRGFVRHFFAVKLKPMTGIGVSYVSGDKSPTDQQLNTFDPMYPRPTFGLAAPLGPANIISVQLFAGISPLNQLYIDGSVYFLARESIYDGSYTPDMDQIRPFPPAESDARGIGTQYTLELFYLPNPNWTFIILSSYVAPGNYVKDTGNSKPIIFFSLSAAYKF